MSELTGLHRRALGDVFTRDLGLKLASLLVALGAWGWLRESEVIEVTATVPVRYTWPEELVAARSGQARVQVSLGGERGAMRRIDAASLVFAVDLHDAAPGVQQIEFGRDRLEGLPTGVEIRSVYPSSVVVDLEEPQVRRLPLLVARSGEPAAGFRVEEILLSTDEVEVRGPPSVLATLDAVVTTPIDLTGMTRTTTVEVTVDLPGRSLERLGSQPVQATVVVGSVIVERGLVEVPVIVRQPGWVADPKVVEVELEGPQTFVEAVRADEVTVMIYLPEGLPRTPILVRPGGDAVPGRPHYEVVHTAGPGVRVAGVVPEELRVRPAED